LRETFGAVDNETGNVFVVDFKLLIRYKKASTEKEEACLMGFSGGSE
jgi:hypothetical protein